MARKSDRLRARWECRKQDTTLTLHAFWHVTDSAVQEPTSIKMHIMPINILTAIVKESYVRHACHLQSNACADGLAGCSTRKCHGWYTNRNRSDWTTYNVRMKGFWPKCENVTAVLGNTEGQEENVVNNFTEKRRPLSRNSSHAD
jgi:hypothetical protein